MGKPERLKPPRITRRDFECSFYTWQMRLGEFQKGRHLIIHCTQKLAKKLPDVSKEAHAETSLLGSWHANLYTIIGPPTINQQLDAI
ncbi:MAG: hypothetical protein GXP09_02940 [Gammaproteobacteria bacterium]|nr:hypothetical protein [Gammaproteobacteria bacterium]